MVWVGFGRPADTTLVYYIIFYYVSFFYFRFFKRPLFIYRVSFFGGPYGTLLGPPPILWLRTLLIPLDIVHPAAVFRPRRSVLLSLYGPFQPWGPIGPSGLSAVLIPTRGTWW